MHGLSATTITYRVAHMCCGIGAGAKGFNDAQPRVGAMRARFECAGGIDIDAAGLRNFEALTGARGTLLDLFDEEQYRAFHGKAPPAGWREATPDDIRRAYGGRIDVLFASMPCKGFSGLLSAAASATEKYQALNRLTLRGLWLFLEAYRADPARIILFENVPRIATRGRPLLDKIKALLRAYGFVCAETEHDCGELGGLGQSRRRFLLVARRIESVPNFLYQPEKKRLRGVGEIIGRMPLPGDPIAGAMHRVPQLQWKTWVRLAFVPAGKDWRALNELAGEDGVLRDFGIVPDVALRDNALGVNGWSDTAPLITGARAPGQGRFSVADPRPMDELHHDALGVRGFDQEARVVGTRCGPTNGAHSVADPRPGYGEATHRNVLGVNGWTDTTGVIGGSPKPTCGANAVADPRYSARDRSSTLGVRAWEAPTGTVQGESYPTNGAFSVADPRPGYGPGTHQNILAVVDPASPAKSVTSAVHPAGGALSVADPRPTQANQTFAQYGVKGWGDTGATVSGQATPGGGPHSVADPRILGRPRFNNVFRIVAFAQPTPAVAGPGGPAGGLAVADPRAPGGWGGKSKYRVTAADEAAGAVIGASTTGQGAFAVADPRTGFGANSHRNKLKVVAADATSPTVTASDRVGSGALSVADPRPVCLNAADRDVYRTQAHYGVQPWAEPSLAIPGYPKNNNGRWSVADPREQQGEPIAALPAPEDRLVARIVARDKTWHRPFTTLELAALQSILDPDEVFGWSEQRGWYAHQAFDLVGGSDATKREWIGNAVPSRAARAMAEEIGETLLLADMGETFTLSPKAIWVRPVSFALAVDPRQTILGEQA